MKRWGSLASTIWVIAFMTVSALGTGEPASSAGRHLTYAGEVALGSVATRYVARRWLEYRAQRAEDVSTHGPSLAA